MFKKPEDLMVRDVRFNSMVSSDGSPFGIADLYAWVEPLGLSDEVPKAVRVQFDKARHAFIYSWFAYDLATLGEMQAIASLELALKYKRDSTKPESGKRVQNLGSLLGLAEKNGWLLPDDIPWVPSQAPEGGRVYYLTMLRNDLFHGSSQLNLIQTLTIMETCCDLIRKLFTAPI